MAENNEKNNTRVESHIKNGVDYLALRKHYEKTGNQDKLDYIIKQYLQFCKYDSVSPVLEGVTLSEQAIETLNNCSLEQVMALLLNDAKPTASLKTILFNLDNSDCYALRYFDLLYRKGKLTIAEFEDIVLSSTEPHGDINRGIENALEILECDTLKEYEGIDLSKIEITLLTFLKNREFSSIKTSFKRIAEAIVKLLAIYSYDYDYKHGELVEDLLRLKQQASHSMHETSVNRCIAAAADTFLFRQDIQILELLDLLSMRPDLVRLSRAVNVGLSVEEKNIVLGSIIEGKCKHTALAMYVFHDLWDKDRPNIINEWVNKDRDLELDIYLSRFLGIEKPLLLEEALELDTQYTAAMEPEDKKKDI